MDDIQGAQPAWRYRILKGATRPAPFCGMPLMPILLVTGVTLLVSIWMLFLSRWRALALLAVLLVPVASKATCWEHAAHRYGVDPSLLKAIAWKESRGWTNAVGPQLPDGNRAIGLMQINSIHLPTLAQFGIRREHLFDACVSQHVGAWVLAHCMTRFGAKWKAVGCYYAGPASKNTQAQVEYVLDVQRLYEGYRREELRLAATVHHASALAINEKSPRD